VFVNPAGRFGGVAVVSVQAEILKQNLQDILVVSLLCQFKLKY